MLDTLIWWLTLELLGLAALPLAWTVARSLPDRGWAFAKILGLLLVCYGGWLLGMLQLAPFDRPTSLVMLVALGCFSLWLLLRRGRALLREMRTFCAAQLRYIFVTELLFALAFAAWTVLRAYDPAIYGTEKFMDFALLNSLTRGGHLPPQDPWFIGQPINYYYFGYALIATLCHLSGVDSAIGYNLANSSLFALTALGAFGIVYNLAQGRGTRDEGRGTGDEGSVVIENAVPTLPLAPRPLSPVPRPSSLAAGLLGAVLLAVAGNLASVEQVFGGGATGDTFDWWAPSRVVKDIGAPMPDTINEFPAFSFILGDLHPHVMALPLVLLALALALALLRAGRDTAPLFGGLAGLLRLFVAALAIGALYVTNTWDFPTYLLIMVAALAWPLAASAAPGQVAPDEAAPFRVHARYWLRSRAGLLLVRSGGLALLALLLFLPFQLTFTSLVGGETIALPAGIADLPLLGPLLGRLIGLVGLNIWPKTWPGFLTIFGLFLFAIVPLLLVMLRGERRSDYKWLAAIAVVAALLALVLDFPLLALLVPLASATLYLLWRRVREPNRPVEEAFVLILLAAGAIISLGTEIIFLQDSFHGRMNTLFKFYYQVWVLWGISAAYSAYWLLRHAFSRLPAPGSRIPSPLSRLPALAWAAGMAALLALSLIYVAYAPTARGGINWLPFVQASPRSSKGLDGMAYLGERAPDDLAAIRWLRANAPATAGIAEAPGPEYNVSGLHGRVSAYTGMPTIITWPGHERQWRAGQPVLYAAIETRLADLNLLYSSTDPAVAQGIITKYGLSYVFIGTIEKGEPGTDAAGQPLRYGKTALTKFALFMDPVFRSKPGDPDPLAGTTIYRVRHFLLQASVARP